MTPSRIIHGREAESRRLYNLPDPTHRRDKQRLTHVQAVFVAGLALGALVGAVAAVLV